MNHIISSAKDNLYNNNSYMLACCPRASCIGLADYPWCSIYLHVLLLNSSMAADISCTFIICVPFYIQFMFFPLRQFSSKLSLLSRFHYSLRRRVKLVFHASLHWTCYNVDICLNCVVSNTKSIEHKPYFEDGMLEYKRKSLNTMSYYDFVMVLQWFLVYVSCAILHCTHKHINGTI